MATGPPVINGGTMYGKAYMPDTDEDTTATPYTPLNVDNYLAGEGGTRREPVRIQQTTLAACARLRALH